MCTYLFFVKGFVVYSAAKDCQAILSARHSLHLSCIKQKAPLHLTSIVVLGRCDRFDNSTADNILTFKDLETTYATLDGVLASQSSLQKAESLPQTKRHSSLTNA